MPPRPLQAGHSSLTRRKLVSDAAGRCRYGRSRRAILHRHDDCATSIRKSVLEIKNRCTKEGENGEELHRFASLALKSRIDAQKRVKTGKSLHRFSSLALKSRIDARKRVKTWKSLHRFASLALKSRIDAVFGLFPGKNLQ